MESAWARYEFLRSNSWCYECSDDFGLVEKDLSKAIELKEKGNELFKSNQFMEAKDFYTDALRYCPFDEKDASKNQEYSIILANRSAVTDKVYLYNAALQDVELALKYNYPRHLLFKIYNRKGHSLMKLRRYADSREAFKKCENWIGKSEMNQAMRDKWRARLKKQMSVFSTVKEVRNRDDDVSPLSKLTVDNVDKMSPGGGVEIEDEVGVEAEEVIFCERPLAMVLNDSRAEGKICPVEMTLMTAPLQCTLGSTATFSSEKARQVANQTYHKYEFRLVEPIKLAGLLPKAKLALRIITTMDPKHIKDVVGAEREEPHDIIAKTVKNFINLPIDQDHKNSTLMEVGVLTSYLLSCLEKSDYSKPDNSLAELVERVVKAVLVHHKTVLYSQGSIDKSQLWDLPKIPLKNFAIGAYPEFSAKLAASKPTETSNVLSFYHRGTLFLQSVRKMGRGCSVNVHTNAAEASAVSFPVNMVNHKCSGKECSLSFPLDKTADQPITCPLDTCGIQTNIWKRLKRIQELKREHEAARREIEFKEDGTQGIQMLKSIIQELEGMVVRPDKFLTTLDEDYAKTLVLKHIESEKKWLEEHK